MYRSIIVHIGILIYNHFLYILSVVGGDDIDALRVDALLYRLTCWYREGANLHTCCGVNSDINGIAERRLNDDLTLLAIDIQRAIEAIYPIFWPELGVFDIKLNLFRILDALSVTTSTGNNLEHVWTEGTDRGILCILHVTVSIGVHHIALACSGELLV